MTADPSPSPSPPRARSVLVIAALTFGLFISCAGRYGVFRDELYYVACGKHLAFGYVDHPPLVAVMARASQLLFGASFVGLRVLPAACAAGMVVLAAELARMFGGRAFAQSLAALSCALAPEMLGTHHFLSMNCVLPMAWSAAALFAARALVHGETRAWVPFGVVCGLALEAKHSTLFFGAALCVGILLTPHRAALRTRGPWLGLGIAALLLLPNIAWEQANGWPTLEFMRNAQAKKMVAMSPQAFLGALALNFNPVTAPLWAGGVVWLLVARAARPYRFLGITFVALFAIVLLGHGKPYYMAGGFPLAYAAGAAGIESWVARPIGRAAIVAVLAVTGAALAPLAVPLLDPLAFQRYAGALGVAPSSDEKHRMGPMPQHFADQFGWEAMARKIARAYDALPPEERAQATIFGSNYGEAGTVDFFGPALGLPPAVSGHNAYFMWGPPKDGRGPVLIAVGEDREDLEKGFEEVVEVDKTDEPFAMPYENGVPIFVCRKPRVTIEQIWPTTKHFI